MNRKRIEQKLTDKHNEFIASIKDESVRDLVSQNSIITGGAIVSLLQSEPVNDFDYYFTDLETCKAVAEYYVNEFIDNNIDNEWKEKDDKLKRTTNAEEYKAKSYLPQVIVEGEGKESRVKIYIKSSGVAGETEYRKSLTPATAPILKGVAEVEEEPLEDKFRPVYLSDNAITLSNKVQLVIRFFGDAEEIHTNYDFIHCTNYWLSWDRKLRVNADALESIITKELKYTGSKYPLCSVIRTRKFLKRGWFINAGQYLKMMFQISKMDLTNVDVLRDQLVGVDSAYFRQLITAIEEEQKKNPQWKVDETYLARLIDEIF